MLVRVCSGGQTGVDFAALRAARAASIPTAGWAPRGWLIEREGGRGNVPAPWLADWGLVECPEPAGEPPDRLAPARVIAAWEAACYKARTVANVRDSDATVWLGSINSRGFAATHDAALKLGRPFLICYQAVTRPSKASEWIRKGGYHQINFAGNRESVSPGIGARAERFLAAVFKGLKESE